MRQVEFFKRCLIAMMCCLMLLQQHQSFAQSQAVAPVANFVVNRAIAGSLTRVAIARGFAANDPRIAATLVGVGSSMTAVNVVATVGGVALAVAGAPVWLTVVGGLGIMAVGAAIVAGTTELKVDSGVVTVTNGTPVLPTYVPPSTNFLPATDTDYVTIAQLIADGSKLYRSPETSGSICTAGSGKPCTTLEQQSFTTTYFRREMLCLNGGSKAYCNNGGTGIVIAYSSLADFTAHYFDGAIWSGPNGSGQYTRNKKSFATDPALALSWYSNGTGSITGKVITLQECKQGSTTGANCSGYPSTVTENFFSSNEGPSLRVLKYGAPAPQQFASLDAAVAGLDSTSKASKISSDTLSKMVDTAWKNAAARSGYTGLPYSATSPVTSAEVQAWQFENPTLNPTINDLLVPAVVAGGSIQIAVDASATPATTTPTTAEPTPTPTGTTNVNVVNVPTVRIDWGADPLVAAPSLEQTPTASAILSPLLNLMPSLRNFVVPSHTSVCPTATINLFQKQLVMQAHCALLDESKPALYSTMAFVWLMMAALITLRA